MFATRFTRPLPKFFLGNNEANERITQFMGSKHVLLSNALGHTDTKTIWYSSNHFEDINKELIFLNANGIRIYFAEYSNDHPEFAGQLCLIFVPTRYNELTGGNEDIILEEESDFQQRPGRASFLKEEGSKPYNYGSPCPPVCPSEDEIKYPFPILQP